MNGAWTDVENFLDILDHVWIGIVMIVVSILAVARLQREIERA